MNQPTPASRRSGSSRPDLGETYPAGHPSGRVWQAPVSLEQARDRMLHQVGHLDAACRDRIDTGYAIRCLDEALGDFCAMVTGGAA